MHLMLPGLGPMGCTPVILTLFASTNKSDYDSFGCLKKYNTISSYHSLLLSQAVTQLSDKYSKARIIFADYNGPVIAALQSPEIFGFNNGATLKVCCGGGGPYNFNLSAVCGQPGVISCENPSEYINWDGIHLTEAAYNAIASGWLKGPFANPPILGPL
ncbi:GDSL esterase/lipase [Rhynchospora pubera]|uniref:GDSL esterase/lipase n=1 Tax=Rhynchospora pubera TaxID=906938 RepID=A0AAV8HPH0_9POAL|nr:GDSL esterase/lipase [Rhynchospora pubera]